MPRIDFAFGVANRLHTASEVVCKHYLAGRTLLIYSRRAQTLRDMDQSLWCFDPASFVAHVMEDDPLAEQTPVVLCGRDPQRYLEVPGSHKPWLVNLDTECPPAFERFTRILEIVSHHAVDTQQARARWRQYVAAGFAPKAHDLSAMPAAH